VGKTSSVGIVLDENHLELAVRDRQSPGDPEDLEGDSVISDLRNC
jgi:hypothetical protein